MRKGARSRGGVSCAGGSRVVEELDERGAALRLLAMSFKNSPFRYTHQLFKPEAGALYTLDEMADDLNSDKFLEACRNAAHNHLYHWLSDTEEGKRPRAVRPERLRDATEIARARRPRAAAARTDRRADARSSAVTSQERVLVVQGPPGTGKSHTLGFAILARALALATPARPFRVAVARQDARRHSVALDSVAKRARQLLELERRAA